MAVIIGRPGNPDRYVYNPSNPSDTSNKVEPDRSPAQLPNIPDNLVTNKMRLQNIVDNKDIYKNLPSQERPGMNVYQDMMQDFRTSTPEAMQTYADRFPLTQFMMTAPEKIARSTMLGNVISSIGNRYNQAKDFVGGLFPGDNTMLNNLTEDFAGLRNIKNDATQIFRDLTPGTSEMRDYFGVKKNNSTDIAETVLEEVSTADNRVQNMAKNDLTKLNAMLESDPVNFVGDTEGLFLKNKSGTVIPATINNLSATQDAYLNPNLPFSSQTFPYYQQKLKALGLTK